MPGEGINDWNKIIDALAQHGYKGPFMYEVNNPVPEKLAECWHQLLTNYKQYIVAKLNCEIK